MPEKAAETLANALERMRDTSLSAGEHEIAVEEFVKANAKLLDKMGVERKASPSRLIGTLISGALLIAVVVSVAFSISLASQASNAADAAKASAARIKAQADRLNVLQHESVISNRENCQRGNASRLANIKNLHSDVATLKAELRLWEVAILNATPEELEKLEGTPVYEALLYDLRKLRNGIDQKEAAIGRAIESQAAVAVKPGSPIADCKAAFPLGAETLGPPAPPSH